MPYSKIYQAWSPDQKKKYYEKRKEYFKEYRQRPEAKAKRKELRSTSSYRAYQKEYLKGYNQNSENKTRRNERRRIDYRKRPEVIEKEKEYRNAPEVKAYRSKYNSQYKAARRYGLTMEEWNDIKERRQTESCMICGVKTRGKVLVIDHCHKTGKFRGLLCYTCNNGLGFFRDNPNFLISAVNYLKNHGCHTLL